MWCISCKVEREHPQGVRCVNNCNHQCPSCGRASLASIQVNQGDTGYSEIKQMVGEAQRKAQRTGERGDIEVSKTVINSRGEYYCQILVYDTQSGNYRSN